MFSSIKNKLKLTYSIILSVVRLTAVNFLSEAQCSDFKARLNIIRNFIDLFKVSSLIIRIFCYVTHYLATASFHRLFSINDPFRIKI